MILEKHSGSAFVHVTPTSRSHLVQCESPKSVTIKRVRLPEANRKHVFGLARFSLAVQSKEPPLRMPARSGRHWQISRNRGLPVMSPGEIFIHE